MKRDYLLLSFLLAVSMFSCQRNSKSGQLPSESTYENDASSNSDDSDTEDTDSEDTGEHESWEPGPGYRGGQCDYFDDMSCLEGLKPADVDGDCLCLHPTEPVYCEGVLTESGQPDECFPCYLGVTDTHEETCGYCASSFEESHLYDLTYFSVECAKDINAPCTSTIGDNLEGMCVLHQPTWAHLCIFPCQWKDDCYPGEKVLWAHIWETDERDLFCVP